CECLPKISHRHIFSLIPKYPALSPDSVCLLEIPAKMPSQLEHAMDTVMFIFHKFASDKNYLTKGDLWVLMEKEILGYMENQKDPMAIDRIMKNLEECRDGKISFEGKPPICSNFLKQIENSKCKV
uniref:Protein S100-A10 n=1 Tax=Naja naja TaxID=35670 RepID=A0A8C6XH26_NAJNA